MKRLFITLMILLLVQGSLVGQTNRLVGIRTLAMDKSITQSERYIQTPEGFKMLIFLIRHPGVFGEALANEKGLPIFKKSETPEGKEIFEVVDTVPLPGGAKSVLLLGLGSPENERYIPVDDKFLNARFNDWLMINTTDKLIGFRIGREEKSFLIKPNTIQNYKVTIPEEKGAAVRGQAELNGKIRTFYSTYWPIRAGERSIVIFVEDEGRIRLRKISDALVPEKTDDTI